MKQKSGCVPALLGGAMISLWVGRWRSQVPSVNSPECVAGEFSEVRPLAHPRGLLCRCTFAYGAEPKGHEYLPYNDRPDVGPLN